MKFLKANWHWLITIIWLALIILLWFCPTFTRPTELNGVGDFLAGAFAPLAFFWLVRGFYQQGQGLKQNSDALRFQAEELKVSSKAMLAQVEEMKASVEQQKLMSDFQRLEIEDRHSAVEPDISMGVTVYEHPRHGPIGITFTLGYNNENTAKNIVLYPDLSRNTTCRLNLPNLKDVIKEWDKLQDHERKCWNEGREFKRLIQLDFTNIYGKTFTKKYQLTCINSLGNSNVIVEAAD